jgi:protein-tyrosine phosphatase
VFNWFTGKSKKKNPILVDIHSHLLPGLDDGVQSLEESEQIVQRFKSMGYTKLITTPHVMSDSYRNTTERILSSLSEVKRHFSDKGIAVQIDAAAEYYLDEELVHRIENDKPVLTFGGRCLLFETNFMTEPLNLREFIFLLTTKGYKPVLAHPERYTFLQQNPDKAEDLINRGVLFQVNINSLSGYYSKPAQALARKLIEKGRVHFVGSDCHNYAHVELLERTLQSRLYQKLLSLPLLNNSLV